MAERTIEEIVNILINETESEYGSIMYCRSLLKEILDIHKEEQEMSSQQNPTLLRAIKEDNLIVSDVKSKTESYVIKKNDYEKTLINRVIEDFSEKLKGYYQVSEIDYCLHNESNYSYEHNCEIFENYIDEIANIIKEEHLNEGEDYWIK